MTRGFGVLLLATVLTAGCEKEEGGKGYNDSQLQQYKQALPRRSLLQVQVPSDVAAFAPTAATAGGTPAAYPQHAVPLAMNVNGLIGGTLDVIEAIAALEPTLYDSDDKEFWWGPFPADETEVEGDHYSLFIHDRIDDADFDPQNDLRYEFAVIRGIGNDVSDFIAVLYGAGSPVEGTDYGIGVLLYDFDNNVEFEDEFNPSHGPLTEGRMATIFLKFPNDDSPSPTDELSFVIAAFRDFLPEDAEAGALPADVDYFWGNVTDGATRFDFLDFAFQSDVEGTATAALEDVTMKLAFFNSGVGRAGATVSGGDVAPETGSATECWDAALLRSYLQFVVTTDGGAGSTVVAQEGTEDACAFTAEQFDDIPDLGDTGEFLTFADAIANAGIPSDLPEENE